MTRQASLALKVRDVVAAAAGVVPIVERAEGLVAESSCDGADHATFTLHVPAPRLEPVLDELAGLGRASSRTVSARDVTEASLDVEARLQNKRALRDRLRRHLASASALSDVLAVEEQLARLQGEIEQLEGQAERLRKDVALSQVWLSLERQRPPGPLGLLFRGLWGGLRKLFVRH